MRRTLTPRLRYPQERPIETGKYTEIAPLLRVAWSRLLGRIFLGIQVLGCEEPTQFVVRYLFFGKLECPLL
jgi:hypothetical protein